MDDKKKDPAVVGATRWRNNKKHFEGLMGYMRGILADDIIHEKEIEGLVHFLVINDELRSKWPGDLVYEKCNAYLRNDMKGHSLIEFFRELVSDNILMPARLPIDVEVESVYFEGKVFCFTGEFEFGTREKCHRVSVSAGADFTKNVTKETNYLVIGKNSNRDWINCSYGRKIEKAMQYKEETGILIIDETLWLSGLDPILKIKKAS